MGKTGEFEKERSKIENGAIINLRVKTEGLDIKVKDKVVISFKALKMTFCVEKCLFLRNRDLTLLSRASENVKDSWEGVVSHNHSCIGSAERAKHLT